MKAYAKKVIANPLFFGSAIMVFGSNIGNFFAYVYHFVIGRLLPPAEYGEVGAILSLLGLLSVLVSFFGLVIVKFVSSSDEKELGGILAWFYGMGFKFALVVSVLVFLASPIISRFLHIELPVIVLIGPIFLVSTLSLILRSFLHGLVRFKSMVVSANVEMILRLVFGVVFIVLGFSVFGVVAGYLLASVANFFILRSLLKDYRIREVKGLFDKHKDVFLYAIPIFVSSFFSYALISLDVIVVKHYFPAEDAGVYTVLSTLGRIVFYAVAPVSSVMFPIIVKRKANKLEYKSIFRLSILMSGLVVAVIILAYRFLPGLVVGVLYGAGRYTGAYQFLPWFGVFVGFYTLGTQVVNYYLSLDKTNVVVLVPLTLATQVAGFILYHESLLNIVLVSTVATGIFFAVLVGKLVYDKEI